jgi:hypothetical protein
MGNNIKIDFRENMDLIHLFQDKDQQQGLVNMVKNLQVPLNMVKKLQVAQNVTKFLSS